MTIEFKLTSSNVASGVVTLPTSFQSVSRVVQSAPGNYVSTASVAPVSYTVVSATPTTTSEVQLTSATALTFDATTALNTTYGVLSVDGVLVGAGPNVGP